MGADRIASLLKASPEGEGIHPSQMGTLRIRVRSEAINDFRRLTSSVARPWLAAMGGA